MDSNTQGKQREEHSCLIQLHMEQDRRMPIKATTHMKHRSQFYCSWGSFRTGGKKKKKKNFGSKKMQSL